MLKVNLVHPTGLTKRANVGISWLSFLFGPLIPLTRGDVKGFILQIFLLGITFGLSWFVTPFLYNKRYITRLMERGYTPKDLDSKIVLEVYNII